ncbi:damage-indicible protein DnaD [Clostridium novyi A str. BKT29909]|uniref:DUF4373 domain-containing protein n=1 Tax=Clostridium novyi TaxID=1542 RepID=UPI0004D8F3D6|nr:DUF4373 domain-containing protein [Clostridium novyi]KEH89126.1 damage-indicible protein DnaD [Clostridium novyi A str. BKT29909]
MARPKKTGLDYFPLDVYLDDKFKFVEIKFKLEGFAIVIKLLQKIYANGYYIEWGEDEELLFTDDIRAELNTVREVVKECLKRDIFSKTMYDKYKVLTSRGIQKRYMEATKKRTSVTIDKQLDLVSEEKTTVSEEKTPVNSTESTQSKVKESKVKKSKENENNKTHSYALELCKYFSELMPGQSIAQHIGDLKIWIDIYGYEWTKEAIQKCVSSKNKFVKPWIKTVLENWKSEGKEDNGGSTRQDIKKGEGKWDGFKPPKPKITEDIDTTDLI